jgi:hypothetical protein
MAPNDTEQYLRDLARRMCTEYGQPFLLVLDPPPTGVHRYRSVIPYVIALSEASPAEVAAGELFEPARGSARGSARRTDVTRA